MCNEHFTFQTGAIAVAGSEFSYSGNPVVVGAVNCSGMETSLSDCSFETLPTTCTGGGVAGIVCQGKEVLFIGDEI